MVFERRQSRLVAVIVLGTFIGGGLGFYLRANWKLKERVQ